MSFRHEPDPIDYAVVDFLSGGDVKGDIFRDEYLREQTMLRIRDLDCIVNEYVVLRGRRDALARQLNNPPSSEWRSATHLGDNQERREQRRGKRIR